jgi:hypothetical protein
MFSAGLFLSLNRSVQTQWRTADRTLALIIASGDGQKHHWPHGVEMG